MRNGLNAFFFIVFVFVGLAAYGNSCFKDESTVFTNGFVKDDALIKKMKKNKMQVIVFRQTESLNNFQNIVISSRSPGYCLTAKGLDDLINSAPQLISKGIEAIYTSPIYGSLQATDILGEILQLPTHKLILEERVGMQNFGTFEGRNYEDYQNLYYTFESMLKGNAPEGESGHHVFQRSRDFLWSLAEGQEKIVLVVTHAFNLCHIHMCLTGEFGTLPLEGEYVVYDFSQSAD